MGALASTAMSRATGSSKVTITNPATGSYSGNVTSKKAKCVKKRNITVYHDDDNNGVDSDDFVIGATRTSKTGAWSMSGEEQPPRSGDTVIAVAAQKKKRSTTCKAAEGSTHSL